MRKKLTIASVSTSRRQNADESWRLEAEVEDVVGVRHVLGEPLERRVERGLDAVHDAPPVGHQ